MEKAFNKPIKNPIMIKFHTAAPTYSQTFKWFREKYELYGLIDYILTPNLARYKILKQNDLIKEVVMAFGGYEEAELACLKKLIELVKNK
jgi:predicted GNAT superfamily acetyltransferase